jgi:hypothetical protein
VVIRGWVGRDAAGTSGFRAGLDGLDLSRGAGTIRNPDEEHLGGGLEDDPLDQLGRPGASLDSAPVVDTAPPSDETASGADGDGDPLSAIGSVELVAPIGDVAGAAIDPSVLGRIPPVSVDDELFGDQRIQNESLPIVEDPPADAGSGEADGGTSTGSSGLVDPVGLFAGSSPIDRSVFGVDRPLLGGFSSDTGGAAGGSADSADAEDDTTDDQP